MNKYHYLILSLFVGLGLASVDAQAQIASCAQGDSVCMAKRYTDQGGRAAPEISMACKAAGGSAQDCYGQSSYADVEKSRAAKYAEDEAKYNASRDNVRIGSLTGETAGAPSTNTTPASEYEISSGPMGTDGYGGCSSLSGAKCLDLDDDDMSATPGLAVIGVTTTCASGAKCIDLPKDGPNPLGYGTDSFEKSKSKDPRVVAFLENQRRAEAKITGKTDTGIASAKEWVGGPDKIRLASVDFNDKLRSKSQIDSIMSGKPGAAILALLGKAKGAQQAAGTPLMKLLASASSGGGGGLFGSLGSLGKSLGSLGGLTSGLSGGLSGLVDGAKNQIAGFANQQLNSMTGALTNQVAGVTGQLNSQLGSAMNAYNKVSGVVGDVQKVAGKASKICKGLGGSC